MKKQIIEILEQELSVVLPWTCEHDGAVDGIDDAAEAIAQQINSGQLAGRCTNLLTAQVQAFTEQRVAWAATINRLACLVLDDEVSSNDRDDAQDAIEMVGPYLEGE
jgi:hypothetical protein